MWMMLKGSHFSYIRRFLSTELKTFSALMRH